MWFILNKYISSISSLLEHFKKLNFMQWQQITYFIFNKHSSKILPRIHYSLLFKTYFLPFVLNVLSSQANVLDTCHLANIMLTLKKFLILWIYFPFKFFSFCILTQKTKQWHKIICYSLENYPLSVRHSSSDIKHLKMQKTQLVSDKSLHIISRMNIMTLKKLVSTKEKRNVFGKI